LPEGENKMGESSKQTVLTYEGVKKLEEELEYLKTVKRKEVTQKIKTALSFGDLSENSEYDEAKNDQAFVEGRIALLENMLKSAKVIDEDDITTDTVGIGCTVKVKDLEFNDEMDYTIVGSAEADPTKLKISNESPVGRSLLGKKVGDTVEVDVPDGVIRYTILEIRK
jgi:transcription elongation factor GreA